MTIQYVEPWSKYDCAYGKGELLIWSFKLESGIGRVDVGCCWLLLTANGCHWLGDDCWLRLGYCWLLLVASGCSTMLFAAGILLAGGKVFEYLRDIDDLRLRQFCRRRSFEYVQDNEYLRLRQFCRRKSLWIFPGYWWFAAKTILQAKKSLNFFEEAMKKFGKDKFWNCLRKVRRGDEEIWQKQVLKLF